MPSRAGVADGKGLVQGSRDKAQASPRVPVGVAENWHSWLDRHSAPPAPRLRARSTRTDMRAFIIQIQPAASAGLNPIVEAARYLR